MQVGELWVKLGVKLDEFKGGLAAAEEQIKATEKRFESLRAVGQRFTDIGKLMTVGVTLPLAAAGGAAIKLGMDAIESENLFEVSMGKMAKSARKWSEKLGASLGLNRGKLRKNIGTWNVMFRSMGLGEKTSYDMSKRLTELAYDMASFYNLKPEEAFDKLRSGITGASMPLKQLGILVDENTVKAYAYKHGIAEAGTELTQEQKVMARYGVILEQTSKAHGDLARTIKSPTNQLRILRSRTEELLESIGMILIPAFSKLTKLLNDVINRFSSLSDAQKKTLVIIAGVAGALGPFMLAIGAAMKSISTCATAVKTLTAVMNTLRIATLPALLSPIGLVVLAIAGVAAVVALLVVAWKRDWGGIQEKTRAVVSAIMTFFENMKNFVVSSWTTIKNLITEAVNFIYTKWDKIKTFTIEAWTAIKDWLFRLWEQIKIQVSSAWTSIYTTITNIQNKIKETFLNLVKLAWNWGKNLLSSFINGLKSKFNDLKRWLKSAADLVASYLGFGSPTKLGPGRYADKWAPNLLQMFAKGLRTELPRLEATIDDIASRLTILSPAALMPAVANNYNTSNIYYGGNTIYVQITGDTASNQADQLLRELRKRGIKL